jgi:carbamoyltransferase
MSYNIIGISALYHDSACCILRDGVLKAAVQEERFTRLKNDHSIPYHALMYCLQQEGLAITDIDCFAYYEQPAKKLERQIWSGYDVNDPDLADKMDPNRPEREIRELLGYEGPVKYYEHHQSHAASSYYYSGFKSAATLTVDGVGEWATTTYGRGKEHELTLFDEVRFPDSLGLLYSSITSYLGFKVNDGEYKVMGLAPYGKATYLDKIFSMIKTGEKGNYQLQREYFDFISGERMYSDKLIELFDRVPRKKGDKMEQFHADVARSLQVALETILLEKANYLYDVTNEENLCMAGGVALNCVANGHILRKGPFKKMFVQPASNDAGCALGAAALAHVEIHGTHPDPRTLKHAYLGPRYNNKDIGIMLSGTEINHKDFVNDTGTLLQEVSKRLADGQVIGWFHGNMEFGPRALGARSILADPRHPEMRDRINAMVKKREGFRPFAPAVLEEKKEDYFELDHPSPFMLETCQVKPGSTFPAITHVDNSARVQTVTKETNERFAALLETFGKLTGCYMVLNTSFNVNNEPIVCTPEDALRCFITTDIDCLVLENFIIDRSDNELELLAMLIKMQEEANETVRKNVYTFI